MESDMTFEEWQMYWYKKNIEVFGKHQADVWLMEDLKHDTALKELWIAKGIKTIGEYEAWEKDHIQERNEFFKKKGIDYDRKVQMEERQ